MPFAYVTESGAAVHAKERALLVKKAGKVLAEWELTHLEALVLVGGVHLTTPAVKSLLRAGVETALLSAKGRLIGQLTPPKPGNVSLRLAHYALASRSVGPHFINGGLLGHERRGMAGGGDGVGIGNLSV